MSIGLDRLKRFVCLLLIFVLLFCFFMCPRASAVALEATSVAYAGLLVGTLLVGAGVAFSNPGDMAKVGAAMYKTMSDGSSAIASKIAAISSWAVEHGKSIGSAALRIGKDLYREIIDTFNASYSDGAFSYGSYSVALNNEFFSNYDSKEFWSRKFTSAKFRVGSDVISIVSSLNGLDFKTMYFPADGDMQVSEYKISPNADSIFSPRWPAVWVERAYNGSISVNSSIVYVYSDGVDTGLVKSDTFPLGRSNDNISATFGYSLAIPAPDLAYPSDDYLVKMPDIPSVDSATGEVTYPDSIPYTKDAVAAPYPIGDDGVKVPDIPFDIPVDQTSGKPMDDTGTDTDTPSKPGEGTDTDKPSDSVNWPSAGDISLPKLIISKFPFCIPFDVARLIGLLEADPKTPIFHVPLKVGTILNEEIVLDLSQWDNAVRIIRWGELIVFVAGLVLVTRNYIKW
ncbi:hypothetical protein AAAV48_01590 [Agathobaculum butyriciproducens]